jgi:hypothetical protein
MNARESSQEFSSNIAKDATPYSGFQALLSALKPIF